MTGSDHTTNIIQNLIPCLHKPTVMIFYSILYRMVGSNNRIILHTYGHFSLFFPMPFQHELG